MSGDLTHSPSDIVRRVLVANGHGTLPTDNDTWPISNSREPPSPDNCITCYTTEPQINSRVMQGPSSEFFGVQIRIRDQDSEGVKSRSLVPAIHSVSRQNIIIGSSTYVVQCLHLISGPIHIGLNEPEGSLHIFTINLTADIRQTV